MDAGSATTARGQTPTSHVLVTRNFHQIHLHNIAPLRHAFDVVGVVVVAALSDGIAIFAVNGLAVDTSCRRNDD